MYRANARFVVVSVLGDAEAAYISLYSKASVVCDVTLTTCVKPLNFPLSKADGGIGNIPCECRGLSTLI